MEQQTFSLGLQDISTIFKKYKKTYVDTLIYLICFYMNLFGDLFSV